MNSETKICQNCKKDFIIESDDFSFYEKIKVPPPTFCPECRIIRRMTFRDYRILYKRKSDRTGNMIFSLFSSQTKFKIWERDFWWSDGWDALNYGIDLDISKSFWSQLYDLFMNVPLPSQTVWDIINSEYCSGSSHLKNCYLVFVSTNAEDCMYSAEINNTKNSIDVTRIESSELCYESFSLNKCYRTLFSSHCDDCMDVYFSRNLIGCNFCFGCSNLTNKQYYIFNKQYSKENYQKIFTDFNLGSYKSLENLKEKSNSILRKSIRRFTEGRRNTDVSGEYINNSKNVKNSYYVNQGEDCKYIQAFFTPKTKDCFDCSLWGENTELAYECSSIGENNYNVKFGCRCYRGSRNCEYCLYCLGCTDCFGCSGLNKKQYCILNKQYTKEEYEKLIPKIKQNMSNIPYIDKKGIIYKYGEYFPVEFSPFCYNESLANDYFPLTEDEAENRGYHWYKRDDKDYNSDFKSENLPDSINDVNDDIVGKIIECKHNGNCNNHQCLKAFKITKEELQFYKRMNISIPRLCHNCRHCERLSVKNSVKLYYRKCMKEGCTNTFETSYAPERPEIIYCEKCYQKEVY